MRRHSVAPARAGARQSFILRPCPFHRLPQRGIRPAHTAALMRRVAPRIVPCRLTIPAPWDTMSPRCRPGTVTVAQLVRALDCGSRG